MYNTKLVYYVPDNPFLVTGYVFPTDLIINYYLFSTVTVLGASHLWILQMNW